MEFGQQVSGFPVEVARRHRMRLAFVPETVCIRTRRTACRRGAPLDVVAVQDARPERQGTRELWMRWRFGPIEDLGAGDDRAVEARAQKFLNARIVCADYAREHARRE